MKRMIAAICAAMMLCGLTGCGTATIPDVTGMSITDAKSKLNDAGFYSVDVKDMNGKAAFDGEVQSQKPKAGKEASTSDQVELVVKSAADQAQEQQKQQLEQKLSTTSALVACREYGKQLYPYGFKTHDIAGVIQDFTPSDENTWFYKATADVTNAFGAKQKGLTYECSVTGTTDAPQVVDFNVY